MARPSTFSIAAVDAATGEVGVAVASKFLAVGAVVPWARAGAGAVATQAWANVGYGPEGLALLESGAGAAAVVERLTGPDEGRDHRQVGIVDARGGAAAWTGSRCLAWAGHGSGEGFTCQGNILAGPEVVEAMADRFLHGEGPLPERLLDALEAGHRAGGDRRGQQSAALLVAKEKGSYGGYIDRYIDLRVDDHTAPLEDLRKLLYLHRLYLSPGDPSRRSFTALTAAVVREIQEILSGLGQYDGGATGVYDEPTREAFRRFVGTENFEERWREDDQVDAEILTYMRRRFGREAG